MHRFMLGNSGTESASMETETGSRANNTEACVSGGRISHTQASSDFRADRRSEEASSGICASVASSSRVAAAPFTISTNIGSVRPVSAIHAAVAADPEEEVQATRAASRNWPSVHLEVPAVSGRTLADPF